jgi:hypothetical protein
MDLKNLFWDALKTLGICIFFGITLISIAGGAVYPPINIIAKPFVCPTGVMTYEQAGYNPSPGTDITTTTWVCTDASGGNPQEIGVFPIVIPAGAIDGFIVFLPVMLIKTFRSTRGTQSPSSNDPVTKRTLNTNYQDFPLHSGTDTAKVAELKEVAEELAKLKQLLASGLITQQDYDQKKAEILTRL